MTAAANSNQRGVTATRYIAVHWHHSSPKYPVELFSELDDASWERRKVELYADGHSDYADASESTGTTALGLAPVPPLDEIAADAQFTPREITRDEFEAVWQNRKNQ